MTPPSSLIADFRQWWPLKLRKLSSTRAPATRSSAPRCPAFAPIRRGRPKAPRVTAVVEVGRVDVEATVAAVLPPPFVGRDEDAPRVRASAQLDAAPRPGAVEMIGAERLVGASLRERSKNVTPRDGRCAGSTRLVTHPTKKHAPMPSAPYRKKCIAV